MPSIAAMTARSRLTHIHKQSLCRHPRNKFLDPGASPIQRSSRYRSAVPPTPAPPPGDIANEAFLGPMFEVVCHIAHLEKAGGGQDIVAEFRRRSHKEFCGNGKLQRAKSRARPFRIAGG